MYLQRIVPATRSFREDDVTRFTFGSSLTARVSGLPPLMAERAVYLWNRFSCGASALSTTDGGEGSRSGAQTARSETATLTR